MKGIGPHDRLCATPGCKHHIRAKSTWEKCWVCREAARGEDRRVRMEARLEALRERRTRSGPAFQRRSKAVSLKQLRAERNAEDPAEAPTLEELAQLTAWRPRCRGDCADAPRPCPYVGCKFHLYLDVTKAGSILFNHPGKELEELPETCALDVAEREGVTLETVGELLNLTRERIRQVELECMKRFVREFRDVTSEPEALAPWARAAALARRRGA